MTWHHEFWIGVLLMTAAFAWTLDSPIVLGVVGGVTLLFALTGGGRR